jgi:hypothetical protein
MNMNVIHFYLLHSEYLEVEKILLHEGSGGLGDGIVVDECGVFLLRGGIGVEVLASFVHEEVGGVLRNLHCSGRVVDGFIGDTIGLAISLEYINI